MRHHVRALKLFWALCLLCLLQLPIAGDHTNPPDPEPESSLCSGTPPATGTDAEHHGSQIAHQTSSSGINTSSSPVTASSAGPITSSSPGTCAFASINYVTRRPPSQCYTRSRPSTTATSTGKPTDSESLLAKDSLSESEHGTSTQRQTTATANVQSSEQQSSADLDNTPSISSFTKSSVESEVTGPPVARHPPEAVAVEIATVVDPEVESPLDNAKFLSFEDWKKQNLPQVPDNAGARLGRPTRARPGLENTLEGLGDDGEIPVDFSGFGGSMSRGQAQADRDSNEPGQGDGDAPKRRSKDAGKTCKERSNYASFDCGANVLKTNPQCSKASSILVENKDSYMLNECSADNKFLIVELCDEVKIDTIVLANFEFFSSIFRTFKVSVSARYPVKIDKWKDIGTFEARNVRDLQAFLVENHDDFARYVRVEFLTQYGSEFYCPVSLFRVHGITAYEEYKLEQMSQEERDEHEEGVSETGTSVEIRVEPTALSETTSTTTSETVSTALTLESSSEESKTDVAGSSTTPVIVNAACHMEVSADIDRKTSPSSELHPSGAPETVLHAGSHDTSSISDPSGSRSMSISQHEVSSASTAPSMSDISTSNGNVPSSTPNAQDPTSSMQSAPPLPLNQMHAGASASQVSAHNDTASAAPLPSSNNSVNASSPDASSSATPVSKSATNATASASASSASPPSREPATQESFFKSIHKRLQHLEANSTLSLQYIESQSALLRDAFEKVERRQVAKTTTFLSILNSTVSAELSRFQSEYESLWQSTIMELSSQREEGRRERELLGERVRVLAEEMVNQKRLMAAQATILLLCLGLVVFARFGGMNTAIDSSLIQGMQEIVNKGKRMRAEEKEMMRRGPRWRWESPWASPSRRMRSSGAASPAEVDWEPTAASTPRSTDETGAQGPGLMPGHAHHQPYPSLDGTERSVESEQSLKSNVAHAIQSAPTTPLSEVAQQETMGTSNEHTL